ncbi:thy-1 membrane glycoprotein-like [Myotis myotis]|uniref:thy-1 membrane glycoprotein-like n=1 Tax=Myotis myotis TaxID=51298 RepID=UPI00174ABFA1|nr:thy-1 membrane glycoprotein-like [Myotis myotis]
MNPALSIALLLTGLQVAGGQKVTSLTACLEDQSLRLDCRHENTTTVPMQFEFSLTRDAKKHVLFGTIPEHRYRSRTNLTYRSTLKVLYLSGFSSRDEGLYTCDLYLPGQPPSFSNRNVSVLRDKLVKCRGVSLLAQDASWLLLLLLLLSLPLLQAMDFVSL